MTTTPALDAFDRDGYLVIENVIEPATLAAVREEYTDRLRQLCREWEAQGLLSTGTALRSFDDMIKAAYAAGLEYFQPLDISLPPGDVRHDTPMHTGPAVFSLMTSPRLLDVVAGLLGDELTSNPIQHVRIKPPARQLSPDEHRAHIGSTDWHQDRAVTLEEADRTRMVTTWIAISDATVDNGCLQVIPGSHRGAMLTHCPQRQLGIPADLFDRSQARPLPVRAGGIVVFHPMTVHGSLDNRSDSVRWSFDLRYNVTGDPTGRPQFPHFVARSAKHPDSVLQDPIAWQQRWLDTRSRLADAGPVTIHRWPADAPVCA